MKNLYFLLFKMLILPMFFMGSGYRLFAQGNALNFNGTNQYVSVADNDALDLTNNFTVEAWIKPAVLNSLGGIVSKYHTASSFGLTLRLVSTSPYSGIEFCGQSTATGLLSTGKWQHVAGVVNAGVCSIYIDGKLVKTGAAGTINANTNALSIGVDYLLAPRYFNGQIDEVRIWNSARTQAEIQAGMYSPISPASEPNLATYYNFDASSGTVLSDLKGTNNGTLTNTPTWVESYSMVVPTITAATNVRGTSFTANWTAPATGTATSYKLDVSTVSTFASFVSGFNGVDCGTSLSKAVTGLTNGTTYYYRVRANKTSVTGTGANTFAPSSVSTGMTGTYTIDPAGSGERNFTTVTAAITALNGGIAGPVTFLVKDDATFNEAAEIYLTATGTAANTITFIQSGDGTNKPIINVPAVGSAPYEMVFCSGSDYITFDGLDFRATSANTTYGIAFAASGTNGCHNNLIQNCNIQLNATNTTQSGLGIEFLFNSTTSNLNNNNKVTNNTISNVSQAIRFIGLGGGYDSGNEASGNIITNLGNTGTNQGIYGIDIEYQLNAKIANNLIQFNPANQVNNLNVVGITSWFGANNTVEINGNTIKDANIAQGSNTEFFRGIYIATGATSSIHDNIIQNFAQTSTNGCDIWGIKIESGNSNVYNNVIKDITNASTSTSARIVGMETLAGTSNSFYNNKVFNLISTGSGTNAGIEGLRIHTGSSNANIYNNMFYNLKCANGSSSTTVSGILLVSGNCNVYNNTVYIDNNSSTSGNISTALYTSTTGTIDLRNNIFVSKGTNSNGAWNIALFRSNTAFNLSAASNNNLYYAGTPGANNKIYHTATSGTPTANTLLDFQAAVTPKEDASVTESATPFVNIASPYDLHIQTGIATLVESHGLPITTPINITTDIDGNVRNASTPDLGADEGDFTQTPYIVATQNNVTATSRGLTNQQIIAVVINTNTTPLATSFTFNTTGSTNAATDIANARLWYTGATGTFSATTQVGSAVANPNGTFTITGSQALTAGDNYFWLTYDVADGATLNNVLDAQCTSVTAAGIAVTPQLTAPSGTRSINGLLSGTYTIDPAGSGVRNFTTFTAAVTALNVGIAGPVTFLAKDDATFNEVATLPINTTGTATNTVTFQRSGDGANKPKILFTGYSVSDACFRLNSCDYFTFNGLEIQANGTSASNFVEWGFYLIGDASNGCQHNTIKNCDISFATANTTSTHGIYLASVATSAAGANSYNTFLNNTILRPARGYYIIGATGSYDVNNKVSTENSGASSISEIGYNNNATSTFGVEYQYQTNLEFANTAISFKSASAVTSAADHIEGIYSRNGNNTASLHHNTITGLKVNKSDIDLSVMGICLESNTSAEIYNNTIQTIDNQNTNSQTVWAIKVAAGACNIYNNVISDIKNNSTATNSGRVVGIESAGTTATIYNNTISNLNYINSSSVGTWGNVVGILAYTGTTATIYNNMLYDLKAANSVANAVTGITFNCTNVNLYNNTVYLDYTSTNASNTSACVWVQNAGITDMRNNIFINKSVMTNGTRATAFYKTAGTISPTTNNNLYYAGTPSAKNLIYYDGTTGYQTLVAYQAVVSPKDNKAVTEAATPFVSAVSPYDLHIKTDVATLLESHGIPITTPVNITADMDGNIRNTSTPDLGADEGNFTQTPYIVATQSNVTETSRGLTNQQVIAVVINTNTTPSATSFTFNTTGSTNATTDIANAKLWYTGDSGTFGTTTQVGSVVASPNGTFTVTGSQTLTAGDNYFWLTYDVADGATVNNVLDAQCTSVTVGGTAVTPQFTTPTGSRKVNGLLSGIYTIDPAGSGPRNFTTFTAAVTALNVGIAGPVTFNVADGATFTASALNITTTGTAVNTITFKQSGTGTKPVINITSSTHLIKVNGGDYFTFDGLNVVNSSGSATYGLYFAGAATNGCQYNTVQNCVVTMNSANTSDCWSVWFSSAATSAAGANNSNHVYTNTFNNGTQIVRFDGISAYYDNNNEAGGNTLVNVGNSNTSASILGVVATYQTNLKIFDNDIQFRNNNFSSANQIRGVVLSAGSNNTVEIYGNNISGMNSSLAAALPHAGISILAAATASIHNNTIHGLTQNTVNGSDLNGIYIAQGNVDIYENEIYNLTNKSTASTSSCIGIQLTGGSTNIYGNKIYGIASLGTGTAANAYGIIANTGTVSANISNNMVYDVKAPNTSWGYSTVGITLYTGTFNVYNNTVYLDYTSTVAGNSSAAIYSETTGTIDLRNNILINKSVMTTGTRAVALWKTAGNLSSTTNNNLYYAGTPGPKNLIFYNGTTGYQTLSTYKALVTPKDDDAVTEAATPFVSAVSPYNLHIDATQTTVASNAATVIGSGATDMDGDTRNVLTPDIGADEFWAPQTITFDAITAKTYGDADFTLPLNASSGLPITYASDNSLIATVSGNTVHIVGAGTCNISANQAGDASYYPAPEVIRELTVNKADPTITLDNITLNYGNAAYNLAASSNSTGGITYTSSIVAVATISGSAATIVRAGTTTITVTQATDDNYKSGTTTATLTVNKIAPVITMGDITKDFGEAEFTVSATSTSTGDFTYTSSETDVATINGNTVTLVGAGNSTITISQEADVNHLAGTTTALLTSNKIDPTITLADIIKDFGEVPFNVSATSNSTGAITYSSSNEGVATVAGSTITIVGAGETTITATQVTDTNYKSGTATATLTVNTNAPTITLGNITKNYGDPDFTITATSASAGALTYSSSDDDVATITGNTVTIVGGGTATITVTQAADGDYAEGTTTATLTVNKIPQVVTFGVLGNKTYSNAPFTLSATASSGLAVSYTSSNTSVATVSGNEVTIVGAGSVNITATQVGNANYSEALPVTHGFTVFQASQSITFNAIANKIYGAAPFELTSSSSSGLALSYSSSNTSVATVSGSTVTINGAGSTIIIANQAGNANFTPATLAFQLLTIERAPQTISFNALADKNYGNAPFTLTGTASSDLAVTYTTDNSSVATVSGNTVTIVGAGTANITANQTGSANYDAAPQVTRTLTVHKQAQTITFDALADKSYGDAPFTVSATGGASGNPVTFTSSNDLIATCTGTNGSTITVIGSGSCTIYANQAGNVNHSAAGQVTQPLTVGASGQTITFDDLTDKTYGDAPFTLTATASSGLPVSYISTNTAVATVLGNEVTIVGAGTTSIIASQTGNVNYNGATNVEQSLTVSKANQTLTLNPLPVGAVAIKDFIGEIQVTASSSSGLPVVISLGAGSVATLNGSNQLVSIGTTGNVVVNIDQAGDVNYNAASISHSFDVVKSNQTITFDALANQVYSTGLTLELSATASSPLAIGYTVVSGPATLTGSTLDISGAGEVIITASQAGNVTWNPASDVTRTLTVGKASQAITFAALTDKTYGEAPFTLTATASSTLPVSYASSNTAVATVSGTLVTIVGAGTANITASQAGNANYSAATEVVQSLTVGKQTQAITFDDLTDKSYGDAPYTVSATGGASGNPVTFTSSNNSIATCTGTNGSTITVIGAGSCTIYANQAGNTNYSAATLADQLLTVNKSSQTITFDVLAAKTFGDSPFTLSGTASSGLAVTYATDNSSVATVSGNTVTIVGTGTANIIASQAGNANYDAATQATRTLTVNKQAQTIIFEALAAKIYGDAPFTVSAPGGASGNPVIFTSSNNSVATCTGADGSTITVVGAGSCTIYANQAGNANYNAAPSVGQLLTVGKPTQAIIFDILAAKTYGDTPYTVSATGGASGNQVTFTSSNSSIATCTGTNGSTITVIGAGSCTIYANQAGNVNYIAAEQVGQLLTVGKSTQSITFEALAGKTYSDAPFTLTATATSGLPVSFISSNTAVATVLGNEVTIVGAGATTITAHQAGNVNYNGATNVAQSLTVSKANQILTLNPLPVDAVALKDFTSAIQVTASSSSGLSVVISLGAGSAAILNGSNQLESIGATGNVVVKVDQAGNNNYNPASISHSFDVVKSNQSITFNALANQVYSSGLTLGLSASASSGLAVSYTVVSGPATLSGNTLNISGVGEVVIKSSQAGNETWNPATDVTQSLTVGKASQTITFNALATKTYGEASFTLTATASSGLPVSYISSNTAVATISGTQVTIVGAGTTNITASQAGNANYSAATEVVKGLIVGKQTQAITFEALADKTYSNAPFTVSATGGASGNPVTFTSSNNSVATCTGTNGSTITVIGTGSCTIYANQAGNANYDPASQVGQLLTVGKQTQAITFEALDAQTYGDAPYTVSATGGASGNPVTFTSSNDLVATCTGTNGSTITLIGSGSCTIYANQTGNVNYSAAGQVTQPLTVGASGQTITFDDLTDKTYGNTPFTLTATASSGLPVSYISTNTAVATVLGNEVTIVGAGTTGIIASQSGNANFNGATDVEQSLTVAKANQILTLNPLPVGAVALKDFVGAIPVTASSSSGLLVVISLVPGSAATLNGGNLESIGLTGNVVIKVDQAGDDNYNAASISHSFDVVKSNQSITFAALANQVYSPGLTLGLSATASSPLAIGYTVVSGPATLSGSTLNISGVGEVIITASQAGNGAWNPATDVTRSLTVAEASQSITFAALTDKTYSDAPFTLTATASSGLTVGYASSNTAVATVSGTQVTIVGAGTTNITASQAGNANFSAATNVVQGLIVGKQTQAITFEALDAQIYGNAPYSILATGGASGNPVTFTSSNNSIATCTGTNGSTITIIGSGSCTIYANQAGNVNYSAATEVERGLNVGVTSQSITFGVLAAKTYGDSPFTLSGTASSGLAVSYTSDNPDVATVSGNTVILVGAGDANIIATQTGNANYDAATLGTRALNVNKQAQSIIFETLDSKIYGDAPFTVSATGGASGNPVTFTSSNDLVATCTGTNGSTITVIGGGSCTIYANQAGSVNYSSAGQVGQLLTVGKPTQAITFDVLAAKTYGDASFTLEAIASSGLAVSYTSGNTNVATISGNTVILVGAGVANIVARQAGNANYSAAQQVTRVLTVNKQAQTINFDPLATKTIGDTPFTVSATGGTSGNPVTFTSSKNSVATCTGTNGSTITIIGDGNCTIYASQAGNANYSAAQQVGRSLIVHIYIAGDTNHDGTITSPEIAGDTNGDGQITSPEIAGDTDGDGTITSPEVAGDTNGNGTIGSGETTGDINGNGTIDNSEISGDTNGDGNIGNSETAGDINGDGNIGNGETSGDKDGNGTIGNGEVAGDKDGSGTIGNSETAGDKNGDGNIGNGETSGDKDGNGTIGNGEVAGDKDGSGTIGNSETAGDKNGDGTIGNGETSGDKDGNGTIGTGEVAGDKDGSGTIGNSETAGDKNGDGTIGNGETSGDKDGNGTIGTGEVAGDKDGSGTIGNSETAGDKNGDGAIDNGETSGDKDGNGTIGNGETAGDTNGNGAIGSGETTGDTNGDGTIGTDEITGDKDGDGTIGTGEVAGDKDGNGTIGNSETAGDINGDDTIGTGETAGDNNGDGNIGSGETAGDTNGDGTIGSGEITGDKDGDGTIGTGEIIGDSDGNGTVDDDEIISSGQIIIFDLLNAKTYGNVPFTLSGTTSSGLPVRYTSSNPAVVTISGNTVTIVGAGVSNITASQDGNSSYNAAVDVIRELTVNKASQNIIFEALTAKTTIDAPFTVSATGGASGSAVIFTSSDNSIATCSGTNGSTITVIGAGSCTIYANQAGNNNYKAAPQIGQLLTVHKHLAGDVNHDGVITSPEIAGDTNGDGSIGSGEVTGDVDGDGTIDGTEVKGDSNGDGTADTTVISGDNNGDGKIDGGEITGDSNGDGKIDNGEIAGDTNGDGSIGGSEVAGDKDGDGTIDGTEVNGDTNGDGQVTESETTQTIIFLPLVGKNLGDEPFTVSAAGGSSGNPVTFTSSNIAVATCSGINGQIITIVGVGTCTITAHQTGNSIFSAADNVSQVLKVDLKTGLEDNPIENQLSAYAIRNIEIRIKGEVSRGAVATLYDMNGRSVKIETLEEGILNVMPTPGLKTGIYVLSVNDHGKIQTFKIMLRE